MKNRMTNEEILAKANEIATRHGLSVEFLGNIQSVGVQGDNRTYTPVLVLVGLFPGWEIIEAVSTEITNTVDVNRVTYELARKKEV